MGVQGKVGWKLGGGWGGVGGKKQERGKKKRRRRFVESSSACFKIICASCTVPKGGVFF